MRLTKYGPKSKVSPSIGDPCPMCGVAFIAGDYTTLVRRDLEGRFANDALETHWNCAVKRWPKGTVEGDTGSQRVAPEVLVGQILGGKYRVEQHIGSGAMGSVFRARHLRLPRAYAVKVLHPWLLADDTPLKRFEREAELAARLSHPNVISVVDIGELDGIMFMVMELGAGPTLAKLLAQAPFEPSRACRLIHQLCDGLAHAHGHGLIHRDLKPENVIVESHAGDEIARIADFGIAILRDASESRERLTNRGYVVGTPRYMAPEMVAGRAFDHRVDLFALGVIAYQLLTGRLPFEGSGVDVAHAYLHDDIPAMATRASVPVDPLLEAFTRSLLARHPDDRPADAMRARKQLEQIVHDQRGLPPVPREPPSTTPKVEHPEAETVVMTRRQRDPD